MSVLSIVLTVRPDKQVYFTEQLITERSGSPSIGIAAPVKRII